MKVGSSALYRSPFLTLHLLLRQIQAMDPITRTLFPQQLFRFTLLTGTHYTSLKMK